MTTEEMVADSRQVEDGSLNGTDDSTIVRWIRCFQNAADLVWNDRLWNFKIITLLGFIYDPEDNNILPDDFGSFEGLGAGVYGTSPIRELEPAYASQMNAAKYGQTVQTGLPLSFSVGYVNGSAALQIFPAPTQPETLNLVYLRKKPRLWIPSITPTFDDQLIFFPEQWHCVIQRGGEWQNKLKSGSGVAAPYQELWKANLDEMRTRERNGGTSKNTLAMWAPERVGGSGGGF